MSANVAIAFSDAIHNLTGHSHYLFESPQALYLYTHVHCYPLLTGVRHGLRRGLALHRGDELRFIRHARQGRVLVLFCR